MALIDRLAADLSQGCAAHAKGDHADRQESDPHISHRHRRAGRQIWRRAGADLRARAPELPHARPTLEPLCALGERARHRQRRHGLPDDAEPAGISHALARHHACRRRGGAAQHQFDRHGAGVLHQRGRAEAHHRRSRIAASIRNCARKRQRRRHALAARRGRCQPAAPRLRRRGLFRRHAGRGRALRAHHRGPRAVHLHIRHHRPAQGRQYEPLPGDAGEPRLRRRHGHQGVRPHVRLPADVPHSRRPLCDRSAPGQRRLGGDPRQILRARVLGRHRTF